MALLIGDSQLPEKPLRASFKNETTARRITWQAKCTLGWIGSIWEILWRKPLSCHFGWKAPLRMSSRLEAQDSTSTLKIKPLSYNIEAMVETDLFTVFLLFGVANSLTCYFRNGGSVAFGMFACSGSNQCCNHDDGDICTSEGLCYHKGDYWLSGCTDPNYGSGCQQICSCPSTQP